MNSYFERRYKRLDLFGLITVFAISFYSSWLALLALLMWYIVHRAAVTWYDEDDLVYLKKPVMSMFDIFFLVLVAVFGILVDPVSSLLLFGAVVVFKL